MSREIPDIVTEARWLVENGVREVFLGSENTSSYGKDLGDPRALETLLDALVPATDSLEAAIGDPAMQGDHGAAAIQRAADVAVKAAEDTKSMLAMRGRAAYTGERSIGSVDAGATAIGVILQAISAAWREKYGQGETA